MAKIKRREKRVKERVGITLQLIVGEDDDLIEAIAALPIGGRQSVLKNLLRQSYGMPLSSNGSHVDFDELRQDMYQELMAEIEKRLSTPYVPVAPPPIEAADQLDSQTANERKNRLNKANW